MLTYCPMSLPKLRDPGSLCLKGFAWMGMTIQMGNDPAVSQRGYHRAVAQ